MTVLTKYRQTKKSKFYVDIIESERGWGQKVDATLYFKDKKTANAYVENFNKDNNLPEVPDWYMYATRPKPVEDEE